MPQFHTSQFAVGLALIEQLDSSLKPTFVNGLGKTLLRRKHVGHQLDILYKQSFGKLF